MNKVILGNNILMPPQSEDALQAEIVKWFNTTYPEYRGLFFHVPNAPKNKRDGARLVAMGLTAGIPDLLLLANGTVYGFELKTQTGFLSKIQITIKNIWQRANYQIFVIRDLESFKKKCKEVLGM